MLQVSLIGLSDADIAIFGGDLNASPILEPHHPYGMMRTLMKDSLTEKFPSASLHPAFATFGNADNTYTHNSIPERIDYLMFRAKNHIDMKVRNCFCEAQGKGRAKGRPRKVNQRTFIDGGWWMVDILSLMLYTKFGCHHLPLEVS